MQKSKTYGLSLPTQLFAKIDLQRGEISRSRFILRILEKGLYENENEYKKICPSQAGNAKALDRLIDADDSEGEITINE